MELAYVLAMLEKMRASRIPGPIHCWQELVLRLHLLDPPDRLRPLLATGIQSR